MLLWLSTKHSLFPLLSDCMVKEPALEGKDDLIALKLWELSTQLLGHAKDK